MITEQELKEYTNKFREDLEDIKIDEDLRTLIFLYLLSDSKTRDTLDLFEILPTVSFVKVVKCFNGRRARLIDSETLDEVLKTTILYNEIENHKMSWDGVIGRYPDWKIDKNRDQVRINKMKKILQEYASKLISSDARIEEDPYQDSVFNLHRNKIEGEL